MPRDGPALLGMPDIELLGILKIMSEEEEGQQAARKFNSQTIKQPSAPSCTANIDRKIRSNNADVINVNTSMQDYFRSSSEKQT